MAFVEKAVRVSERPPLHSGIVPVALLSLEMLSL